MEPIKPTSGQQVFSPSIPSQSHVSGAAGNEADRAICMWGGKCGLTKTNTTNKPWVTCAEWMDGYCRTDTEKQTQAGKTHKYIVVYVKIGNTGPDERTGNGSRKYEPEAHRLKLTSEPCPHHSVPKT